MAVAVAVALGCVLSVSLAVAVAVAVALGCVLSVSLAVGVIDVLSLTGLPLPVAVADDSVLSLAGRILPVAVALAWAKPPPLLLTAVTVADGAAISLLGMAVMVGV